MSRSQSFRRTVAPLVCAVVVAILVPHIVQAQFTTRKVASREEVVTRAVEDIDRIARTTPDNPDVLDRIHQLSRQAVESIAFSGNTALPHIESALADPSKDVKVKAMLCEALGKMKDEKADELLGRILDDASQNQIVLAFAARAIAKKRTPTAVEIIKRTVTNTRLPVGVRSEIMMYVGVDGIDDVDWLAKIAEGEGLGLPADSNADISQNDFTMILNAQRALGRSKNPRAVDFLISFVDRNPANGLVVELLGNRQDPRAIPVLLKALANKAAANDAARALALVKAREAVEPLISIMESSPDPSLVAAAAVALGSIGDKRALPAMEKLVANLKNDPRYKGEWARFERGRGYIPQILKAAEELR
jgi:hypothetical protein